jgi:uncharacterized membrane protein YeiH
VALRPLGEGSRGDALVIATLDTLTHGLDIAGVGANAVLGGVKAREHRFDIVGFATLAITSGLGGGIIRDTLLQHGPPLALTDRLYLITAVAGALVAYLLRIHGRLWERSYRFVDALALGCWAAAGAQLTLSDGLSWQAAVLLGTVTAVGGGVVRDVLLRDVPQIFGGNRLYATSAVLASMVLVLCHGLGPARLGILAGTVVGAALCLVSYQRGWSLPRREA